MGVKALWVGVKKPTSLARYFAHIFFLTAHTSTSGAGLLSYTLRAAVL